MNHPSGIPQHPTPADIASGIGLADRREICALLSLLEAAASLELIKGLAKSAKDKLRPPADPEASQLARINEGLVNGPQATEGLRLRLWFEIASSLGLPDTLPISERRIRTNAAAMGVRASEVLSPSVVAASQSTNSTEPSSAREAARKMLRALPLLQSRRSRDVSFPDIVAAELKVLMDGLLAAGKDEILDPEVAVAIRKGQVAMAAAAGAGAGWVAFATAVGSAGFAPYIVAAQLSAFIPLVSGPALVSFLAVMINPVTVIAGTTALGYFAVKGHGSSARATAAARVAVLLAVSGMRDRDVGIATLATAFRRCKLLPRRDLSHLDPRQYADLIERASRIERRLKQVMLPEVSTAPGAWGRPVESSAGFDIAGTSLVGALTAADMLYHAAAIDPDVLLAIDFSRTLAIENSLDLAVHIASFASKGAQVSIRGYTAEQLVMARLVEQGHVVELAAGSTMPGYDLILDGNPVQVKCGANLSLLEEHFSRYPNIPVIADVDLARKAEAAGASWSHLVTSVDGFDLDYVQSIVDRSLDAAESLGESTVPFYSMVVGGARGARKAWKGEIAFEELPPWLIVDLSIRGGLVGAGQVGGAFVGLLVVGPAGALVLGPVAGIAALLGTTKVHGIVDRAIRNDWYSDVMMAAENLRLFLVRACERRIDLVLKRQLRMRKASLKTPPELMAWLDRRILDDAISIWESLEDLRKTSTLRGAMELMVVASVQGIADPEVTNSRKLLASLIEAKPSTMDSVSVVGGKVAAFIQQKLEKRNW